MLRNLRRKMAESIDEIEEKRLADRMADFDLTPIAEAPVRTRVTIAGEVQSVQVVPHLGSPSLEITVSDGSGRAAAGFGSQRLSDVRLSLTPAAFVTLPGGLISPQDAASVIADRVVWRNGQCEEADGRVRSDALYALGQRLGADLPALDGLLACREGALAILMSGEAEDATVRADILLDGADVRVTAQVETQSPDVASVLQANGFTLTDGIWTLTLPGA